MEILRCLLRFIDYLNLNVNSFDLSYMFLQVVVLQDFKWYDFILKLHKLYNGTHLSVNNVSSRR